jgi:hypothetical protein
MKQISPIVTPLDDENIRRRATIAPSCFGDKRLVPRGLLQLLVIMLMVRGTMACSFLALPTSASILFVPATTGTGFQSIMDASSVIDGSCSGLWAS